MFSAVKTPQERLSVWREFRQKFPQGGSSLSVVEAFKDIKLQPRYIDYYTPNNWPGVFEIVREGYFCQSGITLVMAATLDYLGFLNPQDIHLEVISNHITGYEGLVLRSGDLYYNFLPGKIVDEQFVKDNGTSFDKYIITVDKLYA